LTSGEFSGISKSIDLNPGLAIEGIQDDKKTILKVIPNPLSP
jgi:hypothetical protein